MENLEKLIGKTIKNILQPEKIIINKDGYDFKYYDDNILIEFTDETILKLASWDYEGYSSGIDKEIIINNK